MENMCMLVCSYNYKSIHIKVSKYICMQAY